MFLTSSIESYNLQIVNIEPNIYPNSVKHVANKNFFIIKTPLNM